MRLSLCNEVIRDMPFAAQCDFAAKLGYEALEIAPFTLGEDPMAFTSAQVSDARKALTEAGIVCSSLHWLLVSPEGLSITTDDRQVHARTINVMRRLVDLAAELGADVLVHGSPKQRNLSPENETDGLAYALEAFSRAAEASEKAGVIYCLEPLSSEETNFVNTIDEAAEIVRRIDSPSFRTMVDCAASLGMGQDPVELLDTHLAGDLLAHVQVNDGNRRGPGEGDYRFAPVFETLRKHAYGGWVAVEPFIYIPDGPSCAARSIGYLKGVMEDLT